MKWAFEKLRGFLDDGHRLRRLIQYGFLVTVLIIGLQFAAWLHLFQSGSNLPWIPRPAGVEGFLPISGLIGLKHWLLTGAMNRIHPAATVILLAVITVSLVFKKSFCSFICPIGLISEWHWRLGRWLFGSRACAPWGWKPPAWLDYPLRSLKYLLLAFFLYAVIIKMGPAALTAFIQSPYNKVADVKMFLFFADISRFSSGVIILLAVASLFIANFWCRYLCPYGGLLGIISYLSPAKIRRNSAFGETVCTECRACTRVCAAMINVHKAKTVMSDECTGCLECVRICPQENILLAGTARPRKTISPRAFAFGVLVIYLAFYFTARLTGYWQNSISPQEYRYHIQRLDGAGYGHPR